MSECQIDALLVNCPTPGKFQGAPNGLLTVVAELKEAGFSVQVVNPCLYPDRSSEEVGPDRSYLKDSPDIYNLFKYI